MIKYRHVLVWCLILALLVCLNCNPLLVSATTASAFIDIALNYENIASIPAELLPFVLLVFAVKGANAFFSNIDELINAAQDLSNRCSAVTKKWAVSVANKIEEGIAKFYISDPYVKDINSQLEGEALPTDSYLVIPEDLLGIGAVASTAIIVGAGTITGSGTTTGDADGTTTGTTTGTSVNVSGLQHILSTFRENFVEKIGSLQTTMSTFRTNFVEKISSLQTTLSTFRSNFLEKIGVLQQTASQSFVRLGEMVAGLGSVESVVTGIKTSVQTMRTNLVEGFAGLQNTVSQSFIRLGEMVASLGSVESVVTGIKTSVQTIRTNLVEGFAGLQNTVSQSFIRLGEMVAGLGSVESVVTGIKTSVQTMRTNLVEGFSTLKESVAGGIQILRDSVAVGVQSISTGVGSLVASVATFPQTFVNIYDNFTDTLGEFLTDTIALPLENVRTRIEEIAEAITSYFSPQDPDDEDKNQIVVGGIGSGISFLGRWGSVLKRYTAGFLAATSIFNVFADMSFFDDLINISICIGIVGSLLGIAMSYAKSDAASKRNASNKGGAT